MGKWKTVKLSDMFTLQMGKTPSRDNSAYWNGTHKWVSIADLGKAAKYITDTKECITDMAVSETGIKATPKDTVIMSFKLSIGKTAVTAEEIYTNEAIMSFINKGIYDLDIDYIYHLFSGKDWSEGTNKAVMGVTLNKATLSQISIPLPPIGEQRKFAYNLDKVTYLIEICNTILVKLDLLVKSRFVEMFGDLANPECQWDSCKLIEACANVDNIKCGPFGTQLNKDEYMSSGIAVWEIPQINSSFQTKPTHFISQEKAEQLQSYSITAGDIAMSRKGNVGKCAVFPKTFSDGIIHSDVLRIRLDSKRVNPVFIMCQLHYSRDVQRQIDLVSSGAIMAGINVTKLKQILIRIPPFQLQEQFAAFVAQIDKSRLAVKKVLEKAETLKKALMQEYFG